jgi:predicted transcriptional regulator
MYDSKISKSSFKDYANNNFKLSRVLIDLRITELSELALIQQDNNYFFITEKGQKIIEQLFS